MLRRSIPCILLTVALLATACTARRKFPAPNLPATAALISAEPKPKKPAIRQVVQETPGIESKSPRTVLAISGGGLYGAYAAGVLKGWTASGTRPQFDVVTGISTGALIATGAFLGPEYDNVLENLYTTTETRDVFRRHWLPAMFWSESLADSRPLRQLIESAITAGSLEEIADAYREGRRLYIGTTNLDTTRLVVWDMGAVAASDDPNKLELFRSLLLASCSVPGLMPPVSIDVEIDGKRCTELHVDGGVSSMVFVQPFMLKDGGAKSPRKTNVYVLISGKLEADGPPVRRRFMSVTMESINGVFRARHRADLQRIAQVAKQAGAGFGFAAIPEDTPNASTAVSFDPKLMRQLFDAGYEFARPGPTWETAAPGLDPEDQAPPRTGVRLNTVENPAPPAKP